MDDEDVHLCGSCKTSFTDLDLFVLHKKSQICKKHPPLFQESHDEEAVVISLLANQLAHQQSSAIPEQISSTASSAPVVVVTTDPPSNKKPVKKKDDIIVVAKIEGPDSSKQTVQVLSGQQKARHVCTHSGCSYAARKSKDLVRHMRKHTGTN